MLTGVGNRTLSYAPFEYSPTHRCTQRSGAKACVHTSKSATVSRKRGYRRAEHNRWGGVVTKGHHAHEKIKETARARARVRILFWRAPAHPMHPSVRPFTDLRANIAAVMAIGQYQSNRPLTFYPSSGYLIKTSYFDSLCAPDIYGVGEL